MASAPASSTNGGKTIKKKRDSFIIIAASMGIYTPTIFVL